MQTVGWSLSAIESCVPKVFKLRNSENWFLLCADVLEDKMMFYIKHFNGEGIKEEFKFYLKISSKDKASSRSMRGVLCAPIDMEIMDARTQGFTLDINVKAMERIFFSNSKSLKYEWEIKFSLLKKI